MVVAVNDVPKAMEAVDLSLGDAKNQASPLPLKLTVVLMVAPLATFLSRKGDAASGVQVVPAAANADALSVEQTTVPGVLLAAAIPVSSMVMEVPAVGSSMKLLIARAVLVGAKAQPGQLASGELR